MSIYILEIISEFGVVVVAVIELDRGECLRKREQFNLSHLK